MNPKYTRIMVYSLCVAFMCACFVQVVSAVPTQGSFTVNFPDIQILYNSSGNEVMLYARGYAAHYTQIEVVQIAPGLYHLRHKAWKDFFWKMKTSANDIYRVTNGSFGKEGGSEKKMDNVHVVWQVFQLSQVSYTVFNMPLFPCTLTFDPKTDDLRLAVEGDVISTRSDWEIKQVEANIYNLKCKLFNAPSNIFWKVDALHKSMILTQNGIPSNSVYIPPIAQVAPIMKKIPESPKNIGPSETSVVSAQPKSDWIESEKALNRELLKHDSYDILVVPFQVKGYPLDRIGRSLMTRYLVDKIGTNTDLKVPDPTLVARSLGELSRTFDDLDVYQLANDLKVKTLIKGYVGHDLEGRMQWTVLVQSRDEQGRLMPTTAVKTLDWKDIPFSDERLPSEVFYGLLDDVMSKLPIKQTKRPTISDYKEKNVPLPDTVWDIVSKKAGSPVVAAYYLQLLGALYPEQTASREGLFERSLVILRHISSSDPDYALLKARAYLYLYRRPAALAELKAASTPEEKALVALLNGNMVELEKLVSAIKKPIPRLLAQIELNDLRWSYDNESVAKESYKKIIRENPNWEMLVTRRLQSNDPWEIQSNLQIKLVLDEYFPLPDFTANGLALTSKSLGEYPFESENMDFSVYNHYRKYLHEQGQNLFVNESWYLGKRDLLDLLAADGESNLLKKVRLRIDVQGSPQAGIELLDIYDRIYQGHPEMTVLRYFALRKMAESKQGQVYDNMIKLAGKLKVDACSWLQGQAYAGRALCYTYDVYADDYPRRSYWGFTDEIADTLPRLRNIPEKDYVWRKAASTLPTREKNMLLAYDRELRYTHDQFWTLKGYYILLLNSKMRNEADELVKINEQRFIGHPERTAFLAMLAKKRGETESAKKIYKEAIAANPNAWQPYAQLGSLFIEEGDFKKAAEIFQEYPPFAIREGDVRYNNLNAVALSNCAAYAAFNLWRLGAIDESLPFFTLSQGYHTGSANGMESSIRLSLYQGDYVQAARQTVEVAKRYNGINDYDYYMKLLHLMGYHQEAWSLFDGLDFVKNYDYAWGAPFVGHRMEGRTDEEQLQWLLHRVGKKFSGFEAGENYLILTHLIDRAPNKDLSAILEAIVFQTRNAIQTGKPMSLEEKKTVENAKVNESMIPRGPSSVFTAGYYYLRTGNFMKAYGLFRDIYNIDHRVYSYLLPYAVWAGVKAGSVSEVDTYVKKHNTDNGRDFEYYLSSAFLSAGRNNHKEAVQHLMTARYYLPPDFYIGRRPFYSWYQLIEECEWLYHDTNYSAYKDLAVQFAKIYQRIQPMMGWAYAVEAKYTDSKSDRLRALAITLYLDSRSERISKFTDQEKSKAREWLEQNNPFLPKNAGSTKSKA